MDEGQRFQTKLNFCTKSEDKNWETENCVVCAKTRVMSIIYLCPKIHVQFRFLFSPNDSCWGENRTIVVSKWKLSKTRWAGTSFCWNVYIVLIGFSSHSASKGINNTTKIGWLCADIIHTLYFIEQMQYIAEIFHLSIFGKSTFSFRYAHFHLKGSFHVCLGHYLLRQSGVNHCNIVQ
jgi:hypothetical protein